MLTKARRAARETVYLVLFEEGYRAHLMTNSCTT
jgi:hypothetical protein